MTSEDPSTVRTIAVTADDVVAALEANERRDAGAVLRVTPPFSGRMRARLHRAGTESDYGTPEPLHIPPAKLVASVPSFPSADDTEDDLRSDPEVEYSRSEHRKRHEAAVEAWREAVRERIRDRVTVETPDGPHEIQVTVLG
ncbi:hypothetical protein HWV23_03250 [Natronomonas halophila]|uniref:hypothetical protein n=1 Tax=Natronomonas halophila TaxID=2747817 RepID=UPI0015B70908|nr:hypothetical protein [Natronomonas halophila]QLD84771.1 hypothetical protein HWV23_03250 [Natronomonas halophila]